ATDGLRTVGALQQLLSVGWPVFSEMDPKIFRFHPVNARCPTVRFHSLERLQQVPTGENLFQQVVPGSAGLIVGLCRRHARLSRIPSRLHRYFLRAGLFPAWLPSWRASRTHQDESSLSRSVLPPGELTPRYYDLC